MNFIFIHIPKNAGTSVAKALGFEKTSHHKANEVKQIMGTEAFNKNFSFAIVRNPWDRFVSLYEYAKMDNSYYHSATNPEKSLYGKHLDYDLLKPATFRQCIDYLLDGKLKHDLSWNHWQQQTKWINDANGNQLVTKYYFLENLSDLSSDFKKNYGMNLEIPTINNSKKKNYRDYYDGEMMKIIGDYYRSDIEKFNYDF